MTLRYTVCLMASMLLVGIAANAWRSRSPALWFLSGWVATLAGTAWLITFAGAHPEMAPWLPGRVMVGLLNALAAPLLLAYVLQAVRGTRIHPGWFAPFVVHAVLAAALGTRILEWVPVRATILYEFLFTALAWWVYARSPAPRRDHLPVLCVLLAVSALHLGQAGFMLADLGLIARSPLMVNLPFVITSVWLVGGVLMMLADSTLLRRLAPALAPAPDASDQQLFDRIRATMREQRLWTDPDLDVNALAARLGTHANAVSRALSRAGGTSFYEFVNGHRVDAAIRLLTDPVESRVKVEALGLQAGFKARSTFYKSFRERTGMTPTEFRDSRSAATGRPGT
jgi:AraC-like DNA-binding protein